MINNISNKNIKLFVFGTLRKGGRLDYYMDGSKEAGMHYTEGQLMKSEIGSAYIDFEPKNVATLGEVHYINYASLLRINHLETSSGEFPKGYDLALLPVWKYNGKEFNFDKKKQSFAFFYSRRNNPVKVISGDWVRQPKPVKEIKNFLQKNTETLYDSEDLILHMKKYLNF